ncbi:MAG TPA: DUF1326 domain-containing protein [Nitrososphaeraceae archaeon]|jgi:hypothetical protein|nr:DUF1326 domain-containing protein [Nitrososphaeraceae archaeon]
MTSTDSRDWKLEGDYFEGCNCDSICPCIFLQDPDKGYCNLTVAWHIEKGHYGTVLLDGLNAVGVFVAPGNMFTGPKMKLAFYVDKNANQEQSDALSNIFSGQSGGFFAIAAQFIGEMVGTKSAPITFGVEGKRRWLNIPEYLNLEIEAMKGNDPNKDSLLVNPSFTMVPGHDAVIARSTKYSYNDHGFKWDSTGKNGFYSKFNYSP